jgi:phage-related protein
LRARSGNVNHRILYFFHGRNVAVLSHGFTKEAKVPDSQIDRAVSRMKLVKKDPEKHIAEWET